MDILSVDAFPLLFFELLAMLNSLEIFARYFLFILPMLISSPPTKEIFSLESFQNNFIMLK